MGPLLSHAWYQLGLISAPAEVLRRHPDVAVNLKGHPRVLAELIRGEERLLGASVNLPETGRGAAYLPERDRVMYCVHSSPVFNTNGYSTRTQGVAGGMSKAGADVVVVSRVGYPWDSNVDISKPAQRRYVTAREGVGYVHLPGASLSSTPTDFYILQAADAFVREARLQRPSVIQAASNFRTGLAALIAARRLGVPFVYEVRGLWEITEASEKPGWVDSERFQLQANLETLVAKEADCVLAITQQIRDELVRRGVGPERILLAPNAVDPLAFLPLPKDHAFAHSKGVRTDVPVIGFAGSMVPYEGLDVLAEAAAVLRDRGVDFQLALAGSGSAEHHLRKEVTQLGLGDKVRFLGRLSADEMPRLLSLFDIMPCPRVSVPVTEMVSPLKPLEALSCGKAVVLSDVAPHVDLAGGHEGRALIFRAGDAPQLADVLERLINDVDLRSDLGRAGRLWCLEERTWVKLAETMRSAHAQARVALDRRITSVPKVELAALRVGLVADEFTTQTLRASALIVPLSRSSWREQVHGLDLVFLESAWEGNGGEWHRGVGRYSDEEHRDIVALLACARELGIPTVFWNKEDPIHFERFVATASLCDHVFTTDADRVVSYLEAGAGHLKSASSLPFYAQPHLHNPLPGQRPFEKSAAYAGTYYGDRYRKRSRELSSLLATAAPFGLAIYDRQAALPDSPYHFPAALERHVRGALPYEEVVDSYKAHLANLNVNSVADSPSMFSRRVVEVAACGGVVLSGPGRGIEETLGNVIPSSSDPQVWHALLAAWSSDAEERLREAWLQMRAVYRAHTVGAALTILARTAGIPVSAPPFPTYAVEVTSADQDVVEGLARQSILPTDVYGAEISPRVREVLEPLGVRVHDEPIHDGANLVAAFAALVDAPLGRTHFEDLLHACAFGHWERIVPKDGAACQHGQPIARQIDHSGELSGVVAADLVRRLGGLVLALHATQTRGLELVVAPQQVRPPVPTAEVAEAAKHRSLSERRVVVAGHDLKFATGLIDALESGGARVEKDQWHSHVKHDEQRSSELLEWADIVVCEWGLGNAVWYSRNLMPHQRLVVRVHSQELRRPYLASIDHDRVDAYVFVGDLIRDAAIRSHGLPREKCHVVPNAVDTAALALPKTAEASRVIGLVGIVPQSKRLDLALDVLDGLHALGLDYVLRIKGKLPEDFPWMAQRPDELDWYKRQFDRIGEIQQRRWGGVLLDGHGDDMLHWYQKIGVALSVSDFESFHLTIADGAASGAMPAVLAWPGADLIYPREWLSPTVAALVKRIAQAERDPHAWREVVTARFGADQVLDRLAALIAGGGGL
ncbi:glycosyl transferase group 1 [Intrasporangium calvum DSM 43043]|uniref:D-inositol 3-phosphate glycosyltransferase n=2 Tax=Intrasporangium calvum TaxID=53358 RepID=E6SEQ4_INTC7|nr:glycosyl transferase group 1 [Intrasporangium calvum DSM 43043]